MVSKVDLAVVAALVAGCALWIERGHRIAIDAPTPLELAAAEAAATAAACPDNDRGPYSEDCLAFLKGASNTTIGWRMTAAGEKPAGLVDLPEHAEVAWPVCPDNDNRPYPPACLKFLSGPFWRSD
jgi:hypothetical protein